MTFDNHDFIIKRIKGKSGKTKNVLRRYKGSESVVVIPDGVDKIADLTFGDDIEPNKVVEKIIIPDSVKEITKHAFRYCKALKEIEFPKNLKRFDINFSHCPSLEKIIVPESVETLGSLLFSKTLKTIQLGGNIKEIDFQSYWGIKGKKVANLKKDGVIDLFKTNSAYEITDEGLLINKIHKTTLLTTDTAASEIHIPEGIETISPNTFSKFDSIYALAKIERTPLKKVYIPATVKKISNFAFLNCNALEEVTYEGLSTELDVGKEAFFMCWNFQTDGTDIRCKDRTKKQNSQKESNPNWKMVKRILIIDKLIRQKRCYNLEAIRDEWSRLFGSDEPSDATLNRDIKALRDDLKARYILEYSREKGFYYNEPFTLDFHRLIEY